MFTFLKTIGAAVRRRIERKRHALQVARERRRLDALYGPRPFTPARRELGLAGQTDVITRAAKGYLDRAEAALDAHGNAAIKLDAVEYAFSQLLADLGGVMSDLPSHWTAERAQGPNSGAARPAVAVAA